MRIIRVFCPNEDCRKQLLWDCYLRIGSRFSIRCYYCGTITLLISTPEGISRDIIKTTVVQVTDNDDDDTGGVMIIET